jgi:hypothetical protein
MCQCGPAIFGDNEIVVERNATRIAAAFLRAARPRVVNQNPPHALRGDGKEMDAALPINVTLCDQTHVGFIDQRGRLQRVIATFTVHAATREAMQLAVDHGQQLIGGGCVTGRPNPSGGA